MEPRSMLVNAAFGALRRGLRLPESQLVRRFQQQGYLRDLLRALRVNCVIDVGANTGSFSKRLRMHGYRGHILSFDPLRENYDAIRAVAADDSRWQVFELALGSSSGRREFNVITTTGGTELSSFLTPLDDAVERALEVDVKRLDDLLPRLLPSVPEPRVFLKIDTQGYDVEVMRGSEGALDWIVGLQSEISLIPLYHGMPHYTTALDYYESLGFVLMNLFVVNRARNGSVPEYDALMAKRDQLPPSMRS
jgi:FkbM family methyltransferase